MARSTRAPALRPRRAESAARAALGALVLAALVLGVPAALFQVGRHPERVPAPGDVGDALTAPDDGGLLLTVITLVCWALWAWFTVCLLAEAVVLARHRHRPPRLRHLTGPRRLAAFLLGSLLVLPPATAAAASPAVAVTAPHSPADTAPSPTEQPPAPPGAEQDTDAPAGPVHRVGPTGETLWDIAEQYLGDGTRYKELRTLNPTLPNSAALPAGTQVRLPTDATTAQQPAEAQAPAEAAENTRSDPASSTATDQRGADDAGERSDDGDTPAETRVVQSGETLWHIAAQEYGDGTEYPRIFEANRGTPQPGGGTFTNPDVIIPGQELEVPAVNGSRGPVGADRDQKNVPDPAPGEDESSDRDADASGEKAPAPEAAHDGSGRDARSPADPPSTAAPEQPSEERHERPERHAEAAPPRAKGTEPAEPAERPEQPGDRGQTDGGRGAEEQSSRPPSPPAPSAPGASPVPVERPAQADERPAAEPAGSAGRDVALIAVAGAGVLAAGLIAFVGRQRLAQHQRRRRGRRIAMPSGRAADTEQQLRDVATPHGVEFVDAALRTAAWHLAEDDRQLPDLTAAVLGVDGVTLHLGEGEVPVAPFRTVEDDMRQWWCPAATAELLDRHNQEQVDAPYPTLVTLGRDAAGALVLVDLEHVGAVYVSGARRAALLRTLAVELDTSVLADHLDLNVVDDAAPGLSMLVPERLTPLSALPPAARAAAERHLAQRHALTALGVQSVRQARLHSDVDAACTPLITIADLDENGDDAAVRELLALTAARPRTATALLVCGSAEPPARALHIDTDTAGPFSVPGCPVDVTELVVLSDDDYADLMEIALTSHSSTDVPAEGPTAPNTALPAPSAGGEPAGGDGEPEEEHDDGYRSEPADADDDGIRGEEEPFLGVSLMAQFADYGDDADEPAPVDLSKPTSVPSLHHHAGTGDGGDGVGDDAAVVVPAARPPRRTRVDARVPEPGINPLPGEAPGDEGPLVRVLGPLDITGARGTIASNRRTTALELAVWLVLNPGHDHVTMDKALRPQELVSRKSRNSRITHVRTWLGTDSEGHRYFPQLTETPDRRYRLAESVRCDWHLFQSLAARGEHTPGAPGQALLRQALEIVRGRPFADAPPFHYGWAEPLEQDMTAAIVDVADALAERCLVGSDPRGALWAAARGLSAAPEMEVLHRLRFRAFAAVGDFEGLERAALELRALVERSTGGSLAEETVTLLRSLLQSAGRR